MHTSTMTEVTLFKFQVLVWHSSHSLQFIRVSKAGTYFCNYRDIPLVLFCAHVCISLSAQISDAPVARTAHSTSVNTELYSGGFRLGCSIV
jgi:hypothetical protein